MDSKNFSKLTSSLLQHPVIIGVGECVEKRNSCTPMQLMCAASTAAVSDCKVDSAKLKQAIDCVVVNRFIQDTRTDGEDMRSYYEDPPQLLAQKLGVTPKHLYYSNGGGNSSQYCLNVLAQKIHDNECSLALFSGAEALKHVTGIPNIKADTEGVDKTELPTSKVLGDMRAGCNHQEYKHALALPIYAYPLIANALAYKLQLNEEEYRQKCAELFAPFSKIASTNANAWFQIERSVEELAQVTQTNRMIANPYPKFMNAVMAVNQGASVLICSYKKAMELGVAETELVFLKSGAHANDTWNLMQRKDIASSPAIKHSVTACLDQAEMTVEDIDFTDIYSCFPCAVQIAVAEIGLNADIPKTVIGGLPYFGGAGNNYSTHAICETVRKLRACNRPTNALITANGWYLTKHASGVYSNKPNANGWQPIKDVQHLVDAEGMYDVSENPNGVGTIDSWTVKWDAKGNPSGIVIGKLAQTQERFVANTDKTTTDKLLNTCTIGMEGKVTSNSDQKLPNLFQL